MRRRTRAQIPRSECLTRLTETLAGFCMFFISPSGSFAYAGIIALHEGEHMENRTDELSRRRILASAGLVGFSALMKGCGVGATGTPGGSTGGGACTASIDVSKGLADA